MSRPQLRSILILPVLVLALSACASTPAESAPEAPAAEAAAPTPIQEDDSSASTPEPTSERAENAQPERIASPGESFTTFIDSPGIGDIALQISLPQQARYADGAGIVVEVNTFLTPKTDFYTSVDANQIGLIHVSYLWPGVSLPSGIASEGVYDYGGDTSTRALRDVIKFALGELPNHEGFTLSELISIQPHFDNVGLYAFSHPGLAAVNVMARYGDEISGLSYFVGRENPTLDKLTAVEVGYFSLQNAPILNPLYQYPDNYRPTDILIDYSSIAWDADFSESASTWTGRPYFDLNSNGILDASDHVLGPRVPAANGKRLYSIELLQALEANGALDESTWPSDLARANQAAQIWRYLDSTPRYPQIGDKLPNLKVMLVFARFDHVQPLADKPHIHQAFGGFRVGAKLWVRLNPDLAYVSLLDSALGAVYSENIALRQPADWLDAEDWGHPNSPGATQLVPLAALAEMADRTRDAIWTDDLSEVLYSD